MTPPKKAKNKIDNKSKLFLYLCFEFKSPHVEASTRSIPQSVKHQKMNLTFKKFIFSLLMATVALVAFASNPKPPPKKEAQQGYSAPQDAQCYNVPAPPEVSANLESDTVLIFEASANQAPNLGFKVKSVKVPKVPRQSRYYKRGLSNFLLSKPTTHSNVNADFKVGWQSSVLGS